MTDTAAIPLRKIARHVGQIITVAALCFLVWELSQQWAKVNGWRPSFIQLVMLIGMALTYTAALFLLALNWATILRALIDQSLPQVPLILSYTKTQIAKYVPGNVLHLVTRHMYLKDQGLNHRPVATASILELLSLPLTATLAICLTLPFTETGNLGAWDAGKSGVALGIVLLTLGIAVFLVFHQKVRQHIGATSRIICRAIIFMLCQGLIFATILYAISGTFVVLAIPVAIFAWLIGFVTPGAPGGIAVREVLIINLLKDHALSEEILVAALLFRLVTTAGDLMLYAFGNLVVARYEIKAINTPS